jgi:hypothetical protein
MRGQRRTRKKCGTRAHDFAVSGPRECDHARHHASARSTDGRFIVFGLDLSATTDVFGRTWYWYASSFDPIFLDTPLWLRIMCTIDAYLFGPFYLVLIYALVREQNWIRIPALLYGAAIVYSTAVYFGYEFFDQANRAEANLLAVFLVNIPFTFVPLLLMWRMRRPNPFGLRSIRKQTDPG